MGAAGTQPAQRTVDTTGPEVLGPNNVPGVEQRQGDGPRNFVSQLAQELPRQAKPKGGFADHLPSVRRTLPNSPWRTDIPLATWVDELNPCCLSSSASAVFMNPEVETGSIWTCQICSEPRISPTISLCPTCKRPRGTELRRSYLTASELTQSVVQAVNDDAGGVAGSVRSKGHEKSPAKGASSAAVAARGPKRETRRVSFDGDQVQGRTFQASQKYGVVGFPPSTGPKRNMVKPDALDKELEKGTEAQSERPLRPLLAQLQGSGGSGSRSQGDFFREPPPPVSPERLVRGPGLPLAGPPLGQGGAHGLRDGFTPAFQGNSLNAWKSGVMPSPSMEKPASERQEMQGRHARKPEPKAATGGREQEKPSEVIQETPPEVKRLRAAWGRDEARSSEHNPGVIGSASMPTLTKAKPMAVAAHADMDVEALLEEQKRRIEGLKLKLGTLA